MQKASHLFQRPAGGGREIHAAKWRSCRARRRIASASKSLTVLVDEFLKGAAADRDDPQAGARARRRRSDGEAAAQIRKAGGRGRPAPQGDLRRSTTRFRTLTDKITEFAKRGPKKPAREAEAEAASVERTSLITGMLVALLLIGYLRLLRLHHRAADARAERRDGKARRRRLLGGAAGARPQGRGRRRRRRRREIQGRLRAEGARGGGSQDAAGPDRGRAAQGGHASSSPTDSKAPSARSSRRCRRRRPSSKRPPRR